MRYISKTMTAEHLYFAYGSNMSRARLEERVGVVRDHGWSTLHGHRHAFNKLGADGTAKGNIIPAPQDVVHGVLYQLTEEQLRILAHYEGGYVAKQVAVYVHQLAEVYTCTTYKAVKTTLDLLPHHAYLKHYQKGLQEHGLPQEYCASLLGEGFLDAKSSDF